MEGGPEAVSGLSFMGWSLLGSDIFVVFYVSIGV